jgi:hypothetical protein
MFSYLIFFIQSSYKLSTFDGTSNDNAAIKCIAYQHKKDIPVIFDWSYVTPLSRQMPEESEEDDKKNQDSLFSVDSRIRYVTKCVHNFRKHQQIGYSVPGRDSTCDLQNGYRSYLPKEMPGEFGLTQAAQRRTFKT